MTRSARLGFACCALLSWLTVAAQAETVSVARGMALFFGTEPMLATLRDHTLPLPAERAVCRQCHVGRAPGQASNGAPVLDAASLLAPHERRNGPPSAYTSGSFCRVLRKGIDPAWIMVARAMPLFAASDAQCASLWLYLSGIGGRT